MELQEVKPYDFYFINPAQELMGLTAYVGLAQSLQKLSNAAMAGDALTSNDNEELMDAISMALTWMQTSGIVERHPDLEVIPNEVAPLDFKGDEEHLVEWLSQELSQCVADEKFKFQTLFN